MEKLTFYEFIEASGFMCQRYRWRLEEASWIEDSGCWLMGLIKLIGLIDLIVLTL